jgi:hypothetical protein
MARQLYENVMNFFAPPPRQALINGRNKIRLCTNTTANNDIVVEIAYRCHYQAQSSSMNSSRRYIVNVSAYDNVAALEAEIARKIGSIRDAINECKDHVTHFLEQNTYVFDEKIFYKSHELRDVLEMSPMTDDSFTRLLEQILEDLRPIVNEKFQIYVLK